HDTHPRLARGHDGVHMHGTHAAQYLSVLMKPRMFSGQRVRQGSSAATGGARQACSSTGGGVHCVEGSSGCGPLYRTTMASISKRRSTASPARECPGAKCMRPDSSTHTLLKKFTLATRSRSP